MSTETEAGGVGLRFCDMARQALEASINWGNVNGWNGEPRPDTQHNNATGRGGQ